MTRLDVADWVTFIGAGLVCAGLALYDVRLALIWLGVVLMAAGWLLAGRG